MTKRSLVWCAGLLLAGGLLVGCNDQSVVAPAATTAVARGAVAAVVPSPLQTVDFGDRSLTLWPYTWDGVDPDLKVDPIHLLFPGRGDPRQIRAALLLLGGDRTAFGLPDTPPFDCVWEDALGGANQTAYAQDAWAGSAIQVTCGGFDMRFHLRLFPAGDWSLGAAHFEVNIPGTTEHESLSWELAKTLVLLDLYRAGATPYPPGYGPETGVLSDAPTYRSIRAEVYSQLDDATKQLLGVVNSPDIPNTGKAAIVPLAGTPEAEPLLARRELTVNMNQTVPTFCPEDIPYVHVQGPITFRQQVVVTPSGNYMSRVKAQGTLEVATFTGETYKAVIHDQERNVVTDHNTLVTLFQMQAVVPAGTYAGKLTIGIRVGPGGSTGYVGEYRCDQ